VGDGSEAAWNARAERLKVSFDDAFWLPELDHYAIALDGRGRQVDALTSNIGHCLWTGIVDDDKAPIVAERLMSREMFNGWGVRTLAEPMGAYNPVSYHNGGVWPHDNALIAAGLARYGCFEAAQRIAEGIMRAAGAFGGRLPELFCGFGRDEAPTPIPYPTSCSPQAWAAATPLSLVTTMTGLSVCIPHGEADAAPHLPSDWGTLTIAGLSLGTERRDLEAVGDRLARF
jgi:glycogen debranching enzyme